MDPSQEELCRLVQEGPVTDIFRAEQALSIFNAVEEQAKVINDKNYGEVFGTYQAFCVEQVILSISKIFEQPRVYPLKNIPAILQFFEHHSAVLEITEPHLLSQQLKRLNFASNEFENLSKQEKNHFVLSKLSGHVPNIVGNAALSALKTLRDKYIAHPEDVKIESIDKATWEEAENLLQHAKDIVGVIGDGYCSTVYMLEDGDYLLTTDATRVGIGVARLVGSLD